MKRPIAIGLSPNLEKIDAQKALSYIVKPWKYTKGDDSIFLEEWFKHYYNVSCATSYASARGALYAILYALNLKKGDEILVQAFTCKAVIEPILSLGLSPVYVDIQHDFKLSEEDVYKKITKKTKAIILQHTFAIPNISRPFIAKLRKQRIFIIEDSAHGIGIAGSNERLGTIGDAAIFSFGRDKAFSCVSGGIAITKNAKLKTQLERFHSQQLYPSLFWIFQNLFHSVSMYYCILPLYDFFQVGKIMLLLLQKLHLLSLPVAANSLQSFDTYYKKLPPVMSSLALLQLSRLVEFNQKRKDAVVFYNTTLSYQKKFVGPLLRYPIYTKNAKEIKQFARKYNVYLGDWYSHIIDPSSTNYHDVFYTKGSCPTAEDIADHIVNLPTYPTLTETERKKVAMILTSYAHSKRNKKS